MLKVKNQREANQYARRLQQTRQGSTQERLEAIEKRLSKLEHTQEQLQSRLDKMMAKLISDGILRFNKKKVL